MSLLRQIARGVHALVHGRQMDQDVADEVRQYRDETTAAHQRRGMTYEQAVRAATLEMGNVTTIAEQVRTSGWEHVVETALMDVRYALRRLRRSPAFTATAVATLALGIGASTAVFSAVSPILLEPLPFPHASRIVTLQDRNQQGAPMPATLGTYEELRARARSFEALACADQWKPSLMGIGTPERLVGQRVTASYFGVFGAAPMVGRAFTPADDQPGAANVVILSEGLVQRRFGGDRSLVGRAIDLDGDPYLVIGIMPRRFANVMLSAAALWTPMRERSSGDFNTRAWGHHYDLVGRLAPTATVGAASRELLDIGRTPAVAFPRPPWADLTQGLLVRPLQDTITGNVKPALLAIIGAVLLLLAIASVNVTNLLLACGAQRRPEFAMRVALGAGGGRLVRQLLIESIVLAAVGGALALAVAQLGVRALVASSPPGLPRADAIHLDARVFLFALMLTALVGLVVGVVPALGALRADVTGGLQGGARRATAARGSARHVLVVAEVALALVLLVSAGLLFRSVQRLTAVAPGFDASHVVSMQVVAAGHAFDSDTARLAFFQLALEAVRRVPGVVDAAFTSQLPLSGDVDGYGYEWQSIPRPTPGQDGSALRYAVTPGYFTTMHIPLRRGRLLGATDRPGAPEAVLINESLARRLFGNRDPIGERVRFGPEMGGARAWDYVAGVVGDVKQYSLGVNAPDAFYVASGQWWWVDNVQSLVVRASGDPAALVPAIERAVWSVNANEPIQRIATMDSFIAASAGQRRFALLTIEAFALAALLLAAVGLYGVIAGSVTERIREIGIRTALGATPREIVRGVVGRGIALTLVGAVLGLAGAFAASRLLESMLFGVSRVDPLTYGGVVALLAAVAALASWAPARRAAGVDPTIALRAE
ncbi:MAG TPA: ABC transporter permease [Gemmatimonadaceae bacterium]|nr:ABC transporter permease [Gemmatimonadaceae bacterium]